MPYLQVPAAVLLERKHPDEKIPAGSDQRHGGHSAQD